MSTFVIEYELASGDRRVTEFHGQQARQSAIERRIQLEQLHRRGDGWEIVSLHASSIEAIKETHSRYFQGRELSPVI